jgi:hypothetical protein
MEMAITNWLGLVQVQVHNHNQKSKNPNPVWTLDTWTHQSSKFKIPHPKTKNIVEKININGGR